MPTPRSKPQKSWSNRLGPSQKAVLDWVKAQGRPVTAKEVWEALYATCSKSEFSVDSTMYSTSVKDRGQRWAWKALGALTKKGLLEHDRKSATWRTKSDG